MITKEAQCKIITDYLNASGIVNQSLNDTIMDALDKIEAENTRPVTDRKTEATLRNKFTEEVRDFLSLLGGNFSFKQKSTREFIGNVVDTKDYDVVVFGWLRNDNTIEVIKMESIPTNDDPNVGFMWKNPEDETDVITCLSIPNDRIVEVIQKHPENRKPYHSVKINLKKSTTLYLNITGGYEKPIGTAHVFLLRGAISSEAKQLSSTVSVTIREGNGQQVLS